MYTIHHIFYKNKILLRYYICHKVVKEATFRQPEWLRWRRPSSASINVDSGNTKLVPVTGLDVINDSIWHCRLSAQHY